LEQVKEDWRKLNLKEALCTDTLILDVTDDIEADRQICIHSLASAHGTSVGTLFSILGL
jgi:hypothetical protein